MHKAGVSQLTLAGRGRHARTAGASQTRPPWSLPLARGGAGCSAGGHRNPRRGRVAEGPSARSVPPGGVRARPAAQAGEVRPAGAVRPRSLQASRCAPRSRGVAVAADMPARAVPDRPRPLKQPVGHEREHEHGKQCGPTQGVGMSGISPPLGQGRGLLLLPHDVCGMGHCRRVSSITTAGGWCPESGFLTQPKLGPWL